MPTLRKRFEAFIETMPGYESVDELLRGDARHGLKRADYLLGNRAVIVEQKVLEVDPGPKAQAFMDHFMEERGVVLYGQCTSDAFFAGHPDAERHKRRLYLALTRRLEEIVSDADKQTASTRGLFSIPDAGGLLVIINEGAPTLDVNVVAHRVGQMLNNIGPDGGSRYRNNSAVLIIQECHMLDVRHPTTLLPLVCVRGPNWQDHLEVDGVAGDLLRRWSAFNGLPLVETGQGLPLEALSRLRRTAPDCG